MRLNYGSSPSACELTCTLKCFYLFLSERKILISITSFMSALYFLSSQGTLASIISSVFWVFKYITGSFPSVSYIISLKFYISKSNSLIIWHLFYAESKKKRYKWTYLQTRVTELENKLRLQRLVGWWGKDWGKGYLGSWMWTCTHCYLKWRANKVLLFSAWDSAQCYAAARRGEEFGGEQIKIYVWLNPPSTWNYHNIVNRLDSNTKIKSLKKIEFLTLLMPTQQGPVPKSASPSWYRSSHTSYPNQKPSTPLHSTNHHILLVISLPWLLYVAGTCLIWNFIKSQLTAVTSLI